MNNEQKDNRSDEWNSQNDLDLVGILLTISAITKRLAKLVLNSATKDGGIFDE